VRHDYRKISVLLCSNPLIRYRTQTWNDPRWYKISLFLLSTIPNTAAHPILLTLLLDLFKINAGVIHDLVSGIAKTCPEAFVLIITNPVNSTLPIAVETLKKHNVYNPAKVFGVTTLDVIRASTFVAHALHLPDSKALKIPVVGGHSGATILPLLSLCKPAVTLTDEQRDSITHSKCFCQRSCNTPANYVVGVQFGGDEIVQAKAGAGSATTCMAYAGFRFANLLVLSLIIC
jgi:malate dehydrogenase